jgi:transcriptional regulator with XRE-family HTH domain
MTNADQLIDRLLDNPAVREGYDDQDAVIEAGKLVRNMREDAGLSQGKLADSIGTSQAHLSMIERGVGRYGPTILLLNRIAQTCGVEIQLKIVPDKRAGSTGTGASHGSIRKVLTKPNPAAKAAPKLPPRIERRQKASA